MSYMLEALSGSVQASALDLSQNGIATLEFQDQHRRLYHVTTLLVGRLGDLWEWTVLNHQHFLCFTEGTTRSRLPRGGVSMDLSLCKPIGGFGQSVELVVRSCTGEVLSLTLNAFA